MTKPKLDRGLQILACLAVATTACASDIWYKAGADPDDLAQDRLRCEQSASESVPGTDRPALFERCMSDLGWWHGAGLAGPADSPPAAPNTFDHQPQRDSGGSAAAAALTPAVPAASDLSTIAPAAARIPAQELQGAPNVAAAPPSTVYRSRPQPAPVDPAARQFWWKFGGNAATLERDQESCRAEVGLDTQNEGPSRWGQSSAFDACMRDRGWRGGSLTLGGGSREE